VRRQRHRLTIDEHLTPLLVKSHHCLQRHQRNPRHTQAPNSPLFDAERTLSPFPRELSCDNTRDAAGSVNVIAIIAS